METSDGILMILLSHDNAIMLSFHINAHHMLFQKRNWGVSCGYFCMHGIRTHYNTKNFLRNQSIQNGLSSKRITSIKICFVSLQICKKTTSVVSFSHYYTQALLLFRMMTSWKYFERTLHCSTVQRLEHIKCPIFSLCTPHVVFSVHGDIPLMTIPKNLCLKIPTAVFPNYQFTLYRKCYEYRTGRKYFLQNGSEEHLVMQHGKRTLYDPISQKTTQNYVKSLFSQHYLMSNEVLFNIFSL